MDRHPQTIDKKPADIKAPESQGSNTFDVLRTWVLNKYGAAVVGLTTVGAMATGCAAEAQSQEPAPSITNVIETKPDTNTDANPDATNDAEPIGNETVSNGELSSTLTAEQLGKATGDVLTGWVMQGTEDPKIIDEYILKLGHDGINTESDFFGPIAETNALETADKLFIQGWEENQTLKDALAHYQKKNLSAMETWSKTTDSGNSLDKKPFNYSISIESSTTVSEADDTIVITFNGTEHANVKENRSLELNPSLEYIDGNKVTYTITYTLDSESGTWKIANFESDFDN